MSEIEMASDEYRERLVNSVSPFLSFPTESLAGIVLKLNARIDHEKQRADERGELLGEALGKIRNAMRKSTSAIYREDCGRLIARIKAEIEP